MSSSTLHLGDKVITIYNPTKIKTIIAIEETKLDFDLRYRVSPGLSYNARELIKISEFLENIEIRSRVYNYEIYREIYGHYILINEKLHKYACNLFNSYRLYLYAKKEKQCNTKH